LKYVEKSPGVYDVSFRRDELVSITASKPGYSTNSTKVKNASYSQLQKQSDRDIPLAMNWEYHRSLPSGLPSHYTETECYDLYEANVSFLFTWNVCSVCTMIVIKDNNGNIIDTFGIDDINHRPTNHPSYGSIRLKSPTRKICVFVQDKNGCTGNYHITQ
jgi:hypothetical protein